MADDSPVKGLVEELLKTDAAGDDGGALVDAIDGAYDKAADAAAAAADAETASTVAGNAVAALTAMDDPDTEEDETGPVTANTNAIADLIGADGEVGMNTARIVANEGNIEDNSNAIVGLEEEIGGDANFDGSRIDHNEARSMANSALFRASGVWLPWPVFRNSNP